MAIVVLMKFDVFISHASEDKVEVARPLAAALKERSVRVWLDEFELMLGDSLRRSIDRGLSDSRFGVVILSHSFFRKEWPQKELDGLVAREDGREKVILPIWHKITRHEVLHYSPLLADKLACSTAQGIEAITIQIEKIVRHESLSPFGNQENPSKVNLRTLDLTRDTPHVDSP